MNKEFKVVLVMNLMYNLFLALILSAVAQFMSMGGIRFPAIIGPYEKEGPHRNLPVFFPALFRRPDPVHLPIPGI